jgi:vanillate O-demethylase ferredoxin subunit
MSDAAGSNAGFQIRIASTGALLDVPPGKSMVEVLWANGFDVDTSCETGLCATCMTRYLDGEPEHRDLVLDECERAQYVCVCCSRSRTPVLVLDL